MKRWLGSMALALAGAFWLATTWLSKQLLEQRGGDLFKEAVDRSGPAGRGVLFLTAGLALLVIGSDVMIQENRVRVAGGRKPRYDWVEFGVVIVGGLVFGVVGLAYLLGWV